MSISHTELAGLTLHMVAPSGRTAPPAEPAGPATTCVLFHGFGAPGHDLVPLAEEIAAPVRFVFPEAPIALGGIYGDARAWWMLDLARLEDELRRGVERDRRDEIPEGLAEVRAQVLRMLDELSARFSIAAGQLVLGGFSQGAMLALDVALHRAAPPAGLLLMSGTLLAKSMWVPRMPVLAGVPIVQSHGRQDGLLPFSIAEQLRDHLVVAGARVDWRPFHGGHEIPRAVIAAAGELFRAPAA